MSEMIVATQEEYKDRYVAFLDLLGFKALVCAAENDESEHSRLRGVATLLLPEESRTSRSVTGEGVPLSIRLRQGHNENAVARRPAWTNNQILSESGIERQCRLLDEYALRRS